MIQARSLAQLLRHHIAETGGTLEQWHAANAEARLDEESGAFATVPLEATAPGTPAFLSGHAVLRNARRAERGAERMRHLAFRLRYDRAPDLAELALRLDRIVNALALDAGLEAA